MTDEKVGILKLLFNKLDTIKGKVNFLIIIGAALLLMWGYSQFFNKPKVVTNDCSYFQRQNDQLIAAMLHIQGQMNEIVPDTPQVRHAVYIDTIPRKPVRRMRQVILLKMYIDSVVKRNTIINKKQML